MATWVVEGTWSGPVNPAGNWTRVCHREYVTRDKFAKAIADLHAIAFSDGTHMFLTVKRHDRKSGRRKPTIDGYGRLIRDCLAFGVSSVDSLIAAKAHVRKAVPQ